MRYSILLIIILILGMVTLSSCSNVRSKDYQCPDLEKIAYDNETNTYIQWINCMPSPGRIGSCGPDKEYETWVNENCGIKFNQNAAY